MSEGEKRSLQLFQSAKPGAHVQEYDNEREPRSVLPSPGGELANDNDAPWVRDRVNHRVVRRQCREGCTNRLLYSGRSVCMAVGCILILRIRNRKPDKQILIRSEGDTLILSQLDGTQF